MQHDFLKHPSIVSISSWYTPLWKKYANIMHITRWFLLGHQGTYIFCAWVKLMGQGSTNTLPHKTSSNGSHTSTLVCLWCIGLMHILSWCFCLAFKGLPPLLWIRKSRRQCSSDLLNVKHLTCMVVMWSEWSILLSWCWASYPTSILCSTHFRSSPFMPDTKLVNDRLCIQHTNGSI